jgi:hypothetical protein
MIDDLRNAKIKYKTRDELYSDSVIHNRDPISQRNNYCDA